MGTFPCTVTMITSHNIDPKIELDFGQVNKKLWGKIICLYTAKENYFQADRLEITIWVDAIICEIIFYLNCCLNILV